MRLKVDVDINSSGKLAMFHSCLSVWRGGMLASMGGPFLGAFSNTSFFVFNFSKLKQIPVQ